MISNQDYICYNNGEYLPYSKLKISPDNLGYSRSYGVFDFMRSQNKVVLFLTDHLNRFAKAQKYLLDKIEYDNNTLKTIINSLQKENNLPNSTFKFILTGEIIDKNIKPHLVIINKPYIPYEESYYTKGSNLLSFHYKREAAEIKSLNYINSFRLYKEMQEKDAIDILYHCEGLVSEASRSNVYIVKDKRIITPKSTILHGITRKHILKSLSVKYNISVKDFSYEDLLAADEVFISSTLKIIMPIVNVGGQVIGDGKPGKLTTKLLVEFRKYINQWS